MKYLIVLMSFFLMGVSFKAEKSITKLRYRKVTLISITSTNNCLYVCISQGWHIGKMDHYKFKGWGTNSYIFTGFDLYARINNNWFYHKWGVGLSVFDKQDKHLPTPWDFHFSLQSGFNNKYSNFFAAFHHWSNGRGYAEKIGIEKYWPDKNSGFNALTLGVLYEW